MDDELRPGPRSRARAVLLSGAFVASLLAPAAALLTGAGEGVDLIEKRVLSERPGMPRSLVEASAFPKALDAWFDDHFGGRRWLIQSNARIERDWWHKGDSRVLLGRDGWLYYAGEGIEADYRCSDPFSPEALAAWRATLERHRDEVAAIGAELLLVIAPNKRSIYPEFAPDSTRPVGAHCRLDQLRTELERDREIPFLDLRDALRAEREDTRLFHRTDTHWNRAGALVAASAIQERLHTRWPAVEPLGTRAYSVAGWRDVASGDLAVLLGVRSDYREEVPILRIRREPREREVPPPAWAADAYVRVFTTDAADLPSAVVIHDSTGDALMPFLAEAFRRSVFVANPDWDTSWIADEHPDVVIWLFVERSLMAKNSDGTLRYR